MKNSILFFVLLGVLNLFAQNFSEKISTRLQTKIEMDGQLSTYLIWVDFTDKGNNIDSYFANPETVVSNKSLARRSKYFDQANILKYSDIPVNQEYIEQLIQDGFVVKHKSKWLNSVSGYANLETINKITLHSFVKLLDVVGIYSAKKDDIEFDQTQTVSNSITQPEGVHSYSYGNSFTQLNQISVPAVHDLGYNGNGVTICVMDAGFSNLTHEVFSSMNIAATYDFGTGSPNLTGHSHGTATLSLIGGFKQGELIGPAFGATFLLARTEVDPGETPQEEDNWIAAMEWADSLGVDVTSTSLGYLGFDPPYASYTWMDMDGNTARITIAADIAVGLGITVVNSAGNNGYDPSHNTLNAPADGDSVISIGSVNSSGTVSSFSSVGPTVDGRIKPDLMAMGSNDYIASTFGNQYSFGSGTSFSCPLVAGVCALILQKNPLLTPMQVLQALRSTASKSSNPDNIYGWGIINSLSAINSSIVPVELTTFTGSYNNNSVELNWVTSTETNNYGFEIERRSDTSGFEKIGFVSGNGTSTNRISYNFVDNKLSEPKYYYRLKQIDFNGSINYSAEILVNISSVNDFKLFQNYPNPFNPTTKIQYYLPETGTVKIGLYDLLGNEVLSLINQEMPAGMNNIELNASKLASGIYFVKMDSKGKAQTIKITVMK